MKIKYKLVTIIFLILVVSLLPLAWLAIVTSQKIIVENAYSLCESLSEIISNVAKEELFVNSTYEGTDRVIHGMDTESIRGLKSIDIINVDGIYVEGTIDNNKGKKISQSEIDYIKEITQLSYKELQTEKSILLRFTYPIFIEHEEGQMRIGAAIFDFDKQELFHHVDNIQRQIIIYSAIIILISIIFTFFISNYFTKPLQILKAGVETIRTGNLDHQIDIKSKDEIGELADDFNRMAVALKKTDELKNDFLSNTSHELRTPLNGIIGIAESLLDGVSGQMSKSAIQNLGLIISSGKRLASLVNDILDFSKLKHKELQIHLQPVDIYSITNLIIKLSEPLIKNKNLKLINEIPENMPAVLADENRLQQILYNLIGNAVKFTQEGSVTINAELVTNSSKPSDETNTDNASEAVNANDLEQGANRNKSSEETISELRPNSQIRISITDTGIGIPSDKLEAIFESFEQVDASNTREYGGTGLGLSVTKQLLELQGGKIYAESELGKGSKFIFTLPVTDEKPQLNENETVTEIVSTIKENLPEILPLNLESANPKVENTHLTNANHILVVDDEPINLQVISNHFSLRGYRVTTANNGKEALAMIENDKPDIVLLDVMMPMMTGFEVSQKIRETYDMNELPVLFLTAKNRSSDLMAGFNAAGNDYIVKPFSKEELLSRVGVHIKLKEKTEQLIEYNQNLELKVEERTQELEEAKSEVEELNELVRNLNSVSSLSDVMTFLIYYLEDKYNYTDFFLWLVDSEKKEFYNGCVVSNILPEEANTYFKNIRIPVTEASGSLYITYSIQKPVYMPIDGNKIFNSFDKEILEKGKFCYFFEIPLMIYGEVIGILCLHKSREVTEISPEEQVKLEKLSGQIAGSIQNSNLYKVSQAATESAQEERKKSDKLLLNILPEEVATELKEKGLVTPVLFESTSILFTDFKGFTQIAEGLTPQELIKELDGCFSQFDRIIERNNLEKLKTIGDAYMCAGGIPKVNKTHALDSCLAAIEIQSFMKQMKEIKQSIGSPYWELRLGIHSGPVMAGVVGEKKFAYDVWGDTVNTASRMESSGTTGRINISYATYELVKDYFDCEYRGEIDAKNKGKVKMYYLLRIKKKYSKDEEGLVPNSKLWNDFSGNYN